MVVFVGVLVNYGSFCCWSYGECLFWFNGNLDWYYLLDLSSLAGFYFHFFLLSYTNMTSFFKQKLMGIGA